MMWSCEAYEYREWENARKLKIEWKIVKGCGRKIAKQNKKQTKTENKSEKLNTTALIIVALLPQRVSVSVQQCRVPLSLLSWACWRWMCSMQHAESLGVGMDELETSKLPHWRNLPSSSQFSGQGSMPLQVAHKPDVPLHPNVSFVSSPTFALS